MGEMSMFYYNVTILNICKQSANCGGDWTGVVYCRLAAIWYNIHTSITHFSLASRHSYFFVCVRVEHVVNEAQQMDARYAT